MESQQNPLSRGPFLRGHQRLPDGQAERPCLRGVPAPPHPRVPATQEERVMEAETALVTTNGQALAPQPVGMVRPVTTPEGACTAWNDFQNTKRALIDPTTDVQHISGRDYLKKSARRKIAAA